MSHAALPDLNEQSVEIARPIIPQLETVKEFTVSSSTGHGEVMSDTRTGHNAADANDSPRLLTIQELSQQSRFSVTQIRRLVKVGRIPFLQPGGRGGKLLFAPDALLQAIEPPQEATSELPVRPQHGQRPKWQQ